MAVLVHAGDIVGVKPSFVVQNLQRAFRVLVVAQHDIVSPDHDFSFAGGGVYIVQADIHFV